jgi:ferritin
VRLSVQYVNDAAGNVQAVQVPVAQWKRVLETLRATEQKERLKKDLSEALKEVELKRKNKVQSKTLDEFLRGL